MQRRGRVQQFGMAVAILAATSLASRNDAWAWQLRPLSDDEFPLLEQAPVAPTDSAPAAPAPLDANPADQPQNTAQEEATFRARRPLLIDDRPLRPLASSRTSLAEVRPLAFRNVIPGETDREGLLEAWGQPVAQASHGDRVAHHYIFAPFQRVEAVVEGEVIVSLVARFENPVSVEVAAERFEIGGHTPAVIEGPRGEPLGLAYPERGAMLGFAARGGASRVAHVMLEPPSAEAFVLRAAQRGRWEPREGLADIETALAIAPSHRAAQALRAELLLASERAAEALAAAEALLREAPEEAVEARSSSLDARLRLNRARALFLARRSADAEREVQQVLDHPAISPWDRAAAHLLRGDLLAAAPHHDVRAAMDEHYRAAELATGAVQQIQKGVEPASSLERAESLGAFRDGLWIAVEAYLAIARDVAEGDWRRRDETFAQWVRHAERTVATLAPADAKDRWLLHVRRRALESSAAGGKIDPAPYAAAVLEHGARLLAATSDPAQRARLQRDLGAALLETCETLHVVGKQAAARNLIQDAQRLLEAAFQHDPGSPETAFLLGRAYFVLGLDRAVAAGDHRAAAEWFAKAAALWERSSPPTRGEAGAHGKRLAAMAVSFWQGDQRARAVTVAEQGLHWMQRAVDQGELEQAALVEPLRNLAHMNRLMGNDAQAERYQTRLVDFQAPLSDESAPSVSPK